jgi:hypothetical protein
LCFSFSFILIGPTVPIRQQVRHFFDRGADGYGYAVDAGPVSAELRPQFLFQSAAVRKAGSAAVLNLRV